MIKTLLTRVVNYVNKYNLTGKQTRVVYIMLELLNKRTASC